MSYYLIDFVTTSVDYNFDNVIIGRKISLDKEKNRAKYYIYYQKEYTDVPNEIYVRVPKLRLIYNLANKDFNFIKIPIYPNWEGTNKFIEFITKLENDIKKCWPKKGKEKEFVSLVSKKDFINFLGVQISDKIKITSNIPGQSLTFKDFKITGEIDVVIKINCIWSNSQKMGLSSEIYQIKYYAPPEQANIDFIDVDCNVLTPPPPPPPPPMIPMIPMIPTKTPQDIVVKSIKMSGIESKMNSELPQQIGLKIVPSIKDLKKAIKGLKPVSA
jgi:hypothetical protein